MTAAARNTAPTSPLRRSMISKVKIAQKELGLDDATYRAVLVRVTGRDSASKCTEAQLGQVLDDFKAKGWKPKPATRSGAAPELVVDNKKAAKPESQKARAADHPSAKKARALWISLHQLGAVRDPSERALEAFARRQLGCDRLQWADQGQVYRLIEALKAMAERAGWSQDVAGVARLSQTPMLKLRLANVLRTRLGRPSFSDNWLAEHNQDALDDCIAQMAAELRQREAMLREKS